MRKCTPGIYTLCGWNKEVKTLTAVTYYTDANNAPDRTFKVDFGQGGEYELYLVDNDHDGKLISTTTNLELTMKPNTIDLIKEKQYESAVCSNAHCFLCI